MIQVYFYTKPGCCLCDDAVALLAYYGKRYPLQVEERNILENPAWFERYWDKIPVIEIEGGPILEVPIRPEDLEAALATAQGSGTDE